MRYPSWYKTQKAEKKKKYIRVLNLSKKSDKRACKNIQNGNLDLQKWQFKNDLKTDTFFSVNRY